MWYIYLIVFIILWRLYLKLTCGIYKENVNMKSKVVIVTGANTGIGLETAKDLAKRGARVILACRDLQKGTAARDYIIKETGNGDVHLKALDLCSFDSIRKFSKEINESESRLDVLVNNAGTGKLDNSLTKNNLPIETQANYFGPFLLTSLLLPLLKSSAPSRIINVSSLLHWLGKIDLNTFDKPAKNWSGHTQVYSNTKLMNILFTRELARRLEGSGVTVNSLHPGAVSTDIFRNQLAVSKFLISLVFKTPLQGAQTTIYLAAAPELKKVSAKYFSDCKEARTSKTAQDDGLAAKLWERTELIISKC